MYLIDTKGIPPTSPRIIFYTYCTPHTHTHTLLLVLTRIHHHHDDLLIFITSTHSLPTKGIFHHEIPLGRDGSRLRMMAVVPFYYTSAEAITSPDIWVAIIIGLHTNKLWPCAHNIPERPLHTHSA